MTDPASRPAHAPVFVRSHEEREPNAVSLGEIRDGGGSRSGRQPVPETGLHRVQGIGGYDGLADAADSAEPVEIRRANR
jgi:hypothetical protein